MRKYIENKVLVYALAAFSMACLFKIYLSAPNGKAIPEKDITSSTIESALKTAGFPTKLEENGDIQVKVGGSNFWVGYNGGLHCIYILTFATFKESAEPEKKLRFANRVNKEIVMLRAVLYETEERVWTEYALLTDKGVTSEQIANAAIRFSRHLKLVKEKDIDDILSDSP